MLVLSASLESFKDSPSNHRLHLNRKCVLGGTTLSRYRVEDDFDEVHHPIMRAHLPLVRSETLHDTVGHAQLVLDSGFQFGWVIG